MRLVGASWRCTGTISPPGRNSAHERVLMPDELRSPIKHHAVLHRIDPEQGIRRFYSLMIEHDLFGTVRLEPVRVVSSGA